MTDPLNQEANSIEYIYRKYVKQEVKKKIETEAETTKKDFLKLFFQVLLFFCGECCVIWSLVLLIYAAKFDV